MHSWIPETQNRAQQSHFLPRMKQQFLKSQIDHDPEDVLNGL
jgi:hypothetical protein